MTERQKQIESMFIRLKKMHSLWKGGDLGHRERIEKGLEPAFKKLDQLGVARHFAEVLLFDGYEYPLHIVENSKYRDGSYLKVEDAAAIFGAGYEHIRKMTTDEKKAAKLAKKENAIVYKRLPKKDGKIGIEILVRREVKDPSLNQRRML